MSRLQGAIAATRFGMGARPGEIEAAAADPRGWLKAQIRPDAATIDGENLMSVKDVFLSRQDALGDAAPAAKRGKDEARSELQRTVLKEVKMEAREGLLQEAEARMRHATKTNDSFAERWARFWANHFTVAARSAQMIGLVGPYEREAIRPHVFSNFATLLGRATFHPGMLIYLDAARSIGPSTAVAERRDAGLNENLAREILELHTLGVGSGYTQADIIEFAKALTGWTVGGPQTARLAVAGQGKGGGRRALRSERIDDLARAQAGETIFVEALHEPGARTVLSRTYTTAAKQQAPAILDDLARHPATARHVAIQLARHFVADDPPASAVSKLEGIFSRSNGDLAAMARGVVDLDEAWRETPGKFKSPEELLVSTARATDQRAVFGGANRQVYRSFAQAPYSAPSPAGWPDDTASWAGADAVKKRLEWANEVARRMSLDSSPTEFLDRALGELVSEKTRQSVARAESAEQGFTLALMSPEFQRR